jgi:hypothetical protein
MLDRHKWGGIKMSGQKKDVLLAMILTTDNKRQKLSQIVRLIVATLVIKRDSRRTEQDEYAQMG